MQAWYEKTRTRSLAGSVSGPWRVPCLVPAPRTPLVSRPSRRRRCGGDAGRAAGVGHAATGVMLVRLVHMLWSSMVQHSTMMMQIDGIGRGALGGPEEGMRGMGAPTPRSLDLHIHHYLH